MRSLRARLSVAFVIIAVLTTVLASAFATYTARTMFRQYIEQRPDQTSLQRPSGRPSGAPPGTAERPYTRFGSRERLFQERVREAIWSGTAVAAVIGVLVALWLAQRIARPVTELTHAARAIAAGRHAPPVPVSGRDEIAELGRAFNRMAAQLAEDAEQRRQLFAGITHELRTPLAVVQGTLEGMLDHIVEPTPERIAGLHSQTLLLRRLITDLRDLSLAQAGKLQLYPQPVDMAALVSDAVEAFAPSFQDREISLGLAIPKTLPPLVADPDRLRQVVQNLMDNALRYTPRGGAVRITLAAENGDIRLSVADTGQGIESADLPHIFDHFYRADQSRTRSSGGMGLGLSIVKSLVEAHHGRVTVESNPGSGSTFTVTFPARPQEAA
ncbi:MAG TPA: HAMP domain-containing sensor histidine kinase [bacterium]|nr:HAMP domain-containing sensor histidine kinase [bacterium]